MNVALLDLFGPSHNWPEPFNLGGAKRAAAYLRHLVAEYQLAQKPDETAAESSTTEVQEVEAEELVLV